MGIQAILCLLTFAVIGKFAAGLSCRDASGSDIAWWTALKAPKGYIYGYIQAKQRGNGCVLLYICPAPPVNFSWWDLLLWGVTYAV